MGGFTSLNLMGRPFEAPDPEPVQQANPNGPQPRPEKDEKDERFDAMERELGEMRVSNRQLMEIVGQTTRGQQRAEAPAAGDEVDIDWGTDEADEPEADEPEDPAALVEDLSKFGRDALAKRGFVRKADVVKIVREESRKAAKTAATQVVQRARTEVGREGAVIREFPDLADPESELYKATAAHVRAAVKLDPVAARNPVTLYLAAKAATAELGAGEERRPQRGQERERGRESNGDDFEMEDDDREPVARKAPRRSERDMHIAAQSGDRGRQGKSRVSRDDDQFVMDDNARDVARQMGISAEDFTKEATRIHKAAGGGRRR